MEFKLSPMITEKLFEGDGGSYYIWLDSKLVESKVGAAKVVLKPRGFALPHYADSSKIGYVLHGSGGIAGLVYPNTSEEKVLSMKKGDTISLPSGILAWWYNSGDSDMVIVFLGETSKALVCGQFTYFILSGTTQGILSGFSDEFIQRAFEFNKEANKLAKSQPSPLIIKLEEGKIMPQPCKKDTSKIVINIDDAIPDIDMKNGGVLTTLTESEHPLLGEVGLSAKLEKLDANAMSAPLYFVGSVVQVMYVINGSGRVQIVGIGGELVWDGKVQAGHLFVVPRLFVIAKIADGEGMECFSAMTTSK